eukprot:846743-Rhodomonas_salina.2
MSGTDVAYGATGSAHVQMAMPLRLRVCDAVSGTDSRYAATRREGVGRCESKVCYAICLRVCYAMSSTGIPALSPYALATRCPVLSCRMCAYPTRCPVLTSGILLPATWGSAVTWERERRTLGEARGLVVCVCVGHTGPWPRGGTRDGLDLGGARDVTSGRQRFTVAGEAVLRRDVGA